MKNIVQKAGLVLLCVFGVAFTFNAVSVASEPGQELHEYCSTGWENVNVTQFEIHAACPVAHTATATETQTATATATEIISPTATHTHTATPTIPPVAYSTWHAPTDHEHGDAPPAWANEWSQQTFGHPVVFGGDEATPNENLHKHQAYKGYTFTKVSDNGTEVNIYFRVHMMTNPMDRSAQYHSYEMYVQDATGAVSLWQGWLNFGAVPDKRYTFDNINLTTAVRQDTPSNHIIAQGTGSNSKYVSFLSGKEFWYSQFPEAIGWTPVVIIDVYDPSTRYLPNEHLDPMNIGAWDKTGKFGLDRKLTLRFIVGGSSVQTVAGTPYTQRNFLNPRGWFCADTYGVILDTNVPGPQCADGLPQYIAPTMPTLGDTRTAATYRHVWSCACVLPN